jgi:hypothetical protein
MTHTETLRPGVVKHWGALRHIIDTTGEKFGAATTIAHLAAFSFEGLDSDGLSIYVADALIAQDWPWEVESVEMWSMG